MKRARADGDLRRLFRERLPHMHWTPIETAATGSGVPDVNCCWRGREFWIEFKFTAGWAVVLRPEQVGWLARRARAGGRAFIAVRRRALAGPRRAAADELWLFAGSQAAALKAGGLGSAEPLAVWAGGPRSWPWAEIELFLTNPGP